MPHPDCSGSRGSIGSWRHFAEIEAVCRLLCWRPRHGSGDHSAKPIPAAIPEAKTHCHSSRRRNLPQALRHVQQDRGIAGDGDLLEAAVSPRATLRPSAEDRLAARRWGRAVLALPPRDARTRIARTALPSSRVVMPSIRSKAALGVGDEKPDAIRFPPQAGTEDVWSDISRR